MIEVPDQWLDRLDRDSRSSECLEEGTEIGWFRIEKPIGFGGFGITYRAKDLNLDEDVAIKEFLPADSTYRDTNQKVCPTIDCDPAEFRDNRERFHEEAKKLSGCRHPNIVRVRTLLKDNDTSYMVMDYERGAPLSQVIKRCWRRFEEDDLLTLVYQLLHAVAEVHSLGFIHRDIKPDNIFIRRKDHTPVLLDFGSARQVSSRDTHRLTRLHTPGYAPLEQYTGTASQQGWWSDIYALGATLYHAITGDEPDESNTRHASVSRGEPDPLEPVSVKAKGRYSKEFLAAVDHALRIQMEERPQSLHDWCGELPRLTGPAPRAPFAWPLIANGIDTHKSASERAPGEAFTDPLRDGTHGPRLVMIPEGSFLMGSPDTEDGRNADESPQHEVRIDYRFAIGECPITFEQYDAYCEAEGQRRPGDRGWGRGLQPVINVSWHDARAYAEWLSNRSGQKYRLPTEAEWEYVARAGSKTPHWWGDGAVEGHGNYIHTTDDPPPEKTMPVKSYGKNRFGVFDTAGNVWEWVEDSWTRTYEDAPADGSACCTNERVDKVARGGSRMSPPCDIRSAKRRRFRPELRSATVGFRLVRVLR